MMHLKVIGFTGYGNLSILFPFVSFFLSDLIGWRVKRLSLVRAFSVWEDCTVARSAATEGGAEGCRQSGLLFHLCRPFFRCVTDWMSR
jgi:hypothetical protein